ncbi:MAG: TIR domain-containing protein [Planctomycetota bacterium]|nr:TIR domain-containing protein [Planctomycetota bacterium]
MSESVVKGDKPKVFVSYSQEGEAHSARVRAFADSLKTLEIDVLLDQYNPDPADGWTLWMERGIEAADYVLLVCTETYYRRLRREETPGVGQGVRYEGTLIRNLIYTSDEPPAKFVPVLLEGGTSKHIPTPLLDHTRYEVKFFSLDDPKFARLVAHLTGRDPAVLVRTSTATPPRGPRLLDFQVAPDPASPAHYLVRLTCDGSETTEERFDGDPLIEPTTVQYRQAIATGRDQEDDLRFVGAQLWGGLVAGKVGELFRKLRREASSTIAIV